MPKGGVRITEHVLFGKYRLCWKLGTGRSGTVYLAYHTELEEYRAIKVVPKSMVDYETFRKEALFLKTLRHPGIPIVYDILFDPNNMGLVEEYLEGESIYNLVKRLGRLSKKTAVDIGIQICRLIQYMNSLENPILYLDLQPKNLLVCDGVVRLTDFDHAQYEKDVQTFGERYGTVGFAAPEQYRGGPLDCRTDVYAIGALLYFMCYGKVPGKDSELDTSEADRKLDRIIRGCMAQKKEDRYGSAEELEHALIEWKDSNKKEHAIESLKIVFVGAKAGIGTTHAALGMSVFLTRNGFQTLYQEEYDADSIRNLVRNRNAKPDSCGVYQIGCLNIRPFYGRSVRMPYPYFPVIVKDAGTMWQGTKELPEADFYVLVCGGKPWETDCTARAAARLKSCGQVILLWNHLSGQKKHRKSKVFDELNGFYLPFFTDPFVCDAHADACFRDVLQAGTGDKERWREKRRRGIFRKKKPE